LIPQPIAFCKLKTAELRKRKAAGNVTTFAYDALNRLRSATDSLGTPTGQGFDRNGTLASLTNGLGRISALAHNMGERLTAVTTPSGAQTRYGYDGRNFLQRVTWPSGRNGTGSAPPTSPASLILEKPPVRLALSEQCRAPS
jgi:YD repeat-containing protein